MRLLNAKSLRFTDFFDEECPPYYILSHTWTGRETTFQEFAGETWIKDKLDDLPTGIKKVIKFADFALAEQCEWIWVDTCCINKESSAELSEAINSMYKWYEDSIQCVVYLTDVQIDARGVEKGRLEDSRWFTRGWTLQELLAPRHCSFVDKTWKRIGSRRGMATRISSITGIAPDILKASNPSDEISTEPIARRMQWASRRKTTRPEDAAYSLLGIFKVNMSLLYGEGSNAFIRLQRKLLKRTSDESLFAWPKLSRDRDRDWVGMFAPHPSAFEGCIKIYRISTPSPPIGLSNRGVEFRVYNRNFAELPEGTRLAMPLDCLNSNHRRLGVPIIFRKGRWCRDSDRDLIDMGRRDIQGTLFPTNNESFKSFFVKSASSLSGDAGMADLQDKRSQQTLMRFSDQDIEWRSLLSGLEFDQLPGLSPKWSKIRPEIRIVQCQIAQIATWITYGKLWNQNRTLENFPTLIHRDWHDIAIDMFKRSKGNKDNIDNTDTVLGRGAEPEQERQFDNIRNRLYDLKPTGAPLSRQPSADKRPQRKDE